MAKGLIEQSTLTTIADAIREKAKIADTMLPSEMAGLIAGLGGGVTIMRGTVYPTSGSSTLSLNCELPESDFEFLVILPVNNISATSSARIFGFKYLKSEGTVLQKTELRLTTGSENATSSNANITHKSGSISFGISLVSNQMEWVYVYG